MSYVPSTVAEREEMLKAIGMKSFSDLYVDIPKDLLHDGQYKYLKHETKTEFEVLDELTEVSQKNMQYKTIFRGAGAYRHFIPSCVRHLSSRPEIVTAYTPYQAEISQGVLQAIFEYQTTMSMLTGMDASNASVYDGATAAAEAIVMCKERKLNTAIVSATVSPYSLSVIKTYAKGININVVVCPEKDGITDLEALKGLVNAETAAVYVETPNYYGIIEDGEKIAEITHTTKAKFIAGVNPISLGMLTPPGEYGADIAVGEGQPLGMPLSFGGPYLGFITCKKDMLRKMPGRIVGQTTDLDGKRAFVLTLQAREQHIRREKATSSICSNQALCAFAATIYCAAMGPQGLYDVAYNSSANAKYLCERITSVKGFKKAYDTTNHFHEFVTTYDGCVDTLMKTLHDNGILGGLPLGDNRILWCATEVNTKAEIDKLYEILKGCESR